MSTYLPATISSAQLDILSAPAFGGEFDVYFSYTPARHIGSISMSAPAAGTYTDDAATTLTAGTGDDIQIVCRSPLTSSVACVITFATLDNSGTPIAMNGVATFSPPAWVPDASFNFPRGVATDLVPATAGKKYTAITSLTSTAGGAANAAFDLYVLPPSSSYVAVGCVSGIDFNDKSRVAKGVDCQMETDAFVKAGKTNPGDLSINGKFKSPQEGIARFSGQKVTAKLVLRKEGQVISDVLVFTQYAPNTKVSAPDGDDVAMVSCQGKFVELLMFSAPYTP